MTATGNPDSHAPFRCGYIAIVGLPNAGKSTLMNQYLHEKFSIVTPKPQTTRENVTCILTTEEYQIIFVDTPGILKPKYKMQEVMSSYVTAAVDDADVILVMIDASDYRESMHPLLVEFAGTLSGGKVAVALNKIDLVKKSRLLRIIGDTAELFPGAEIVPISALNGDGTGELLEILLAGVPEGPPMFPEDMISDAPERFFVAELIREAVFLTMEQEIPYASGVTIDKFEDKSDKTVIYASILVERKTQKPILIGKRGATIKTIGIMARQAIEAFLGRGVYLDLHVKVRDDWRNKDTFLRELGLVKR